MRVSIILWNWGRDKSEIEEEKTEVAKFWVLSRKNMDGICRVHHGRMDGRRAGRTDGRADGRTDGRTKRRTKGAEDGRTAIAMHRVRDRWTNGWINGRMVDDGMTEAYYERWMDEGTNSTKDWWTNGRTNPLVDLQERIWKGKMR